MRSQRAMSAQSVPVRDTTPEEEFDVSGPGPAPGTAPGASSATASANPFVSEKPASASAPQAGGSPTGGVTAGESPLVAVQLEGDQTALLVGLLRQSLQQNQQMMQQNQQLVATMLRRMDERRNKAEEKVAETAEAAKKAAEAALTRDPFDPRAAAFSADPVDKGPGGFGSSNRAEKYLPPLPLIDHHVMGKGRMKEVEGWHTFLETLSSWLALQEEAFVRELQLCVPVKTEILQTKLPSDTAARSSKLFYYLTQSLAKWERGLELLRSCSRDKA